MVTMKSPSSLCRVLQVLVVAALLSQLAIVPVGAEAEAIVNKVFAEDQVASTKVPVLTVAWLTLIMAVATGLGALPFFFVQLEPRWGGICNGVAAGVMLTASFDLIEEGQRFGGGSKVVIGILAGGLFIYVSQHLVEKYFGEVSMLDVKGADVRKMILVVSIMTLHSFGEGSGVGVSFAGPKGLSQGLMVTIAIAVHNIPEGLAVSLLLSSQGLSAKQSMLWSIFTSLPQPLVAVPAFLCAEAFQMFLPLCMGFAGGCMIWMVVAEVMPDSFKDAEKSEVAAAAILAVTFMEAISALLDSNEGAQPEKVNLFLIYLSLGIGPLLGVVIHSLLLSSVTLPVAMATGIGEGIALVTATWKPLQMLLDGRVNIIQIVFLVCGGAFLQLLLLRNFVKSKPKAKGEVFLLGSAITSPLARSACLASLAISFYSFVEGLAMGVAATSGYNRYLVFLVALHGLPRGVAVGSLVYGASGSKKGSILAAACSAMAAPMGAVFAALSGVGPSGLEFWLVLAGGSVFPWSRAVAFFRGQQSVKVDPNTTYVGILFGVVLTIMCVVTVRLVCLQTPYCGTSL